jgi:hypothetical protein
MVERYEEIRPQWQDTINAAVRDGTPIEDLVFFVKKDGSLERFHGKLPSVTPEPGHCVIVLAVKTTPEGEPAVRMTYAAPWPTQPEGDPNE